MSSEFPQHDPSQDEPSSPDNHGDGDGDDTDADVNDSDSLRSSDGNSSDPDRNTNRNTATCPPFQPNDLLRQIMWDNAARWLLVILVILLLLPSVLATQYGPDLIPPTISVMFTTFVIVAWVWMGTVSRRAADRLMRATALLEQDGTAAESHLAEGMRRRPIGRSIRLLLFHRLAVLRHRQGKFYEAGLITQTMLTLPLRSVEHIRTHLLLLLAESQMRCGHPQIAHDAMRQLHARKLQLVESLQLLALQTQYEVSLGYHTDALSNLDEKIRLSQIMPGPQSGALHAMLATAAKQMQRNELADWLDRRAKLLCSDKQLEELTLPAFNAAGAFGTAVVSPPASL